MPNKVSFGEIRTVSSVIEADGSLIDLAAAEGASIVLSALGGMEGRDTAADVAAAVGSLLIAGFVSEFLLVITEDVEVGDVVSVVPAGAGTLNIRFA